MQNDSSILLIWSYRSFDGLVAQWLQLTLQRLRDSTILLMEVIISLLLITATLALITQAWL